MSSSLPLLSSTFTTSFPPTNTRSSISQQAFKTHGFRVSCNNNPQDDHNDKQLILPNVDRRNMLVGLGGLYTAANLTSLPPAALADPIEIPDDFLSTCTVANPAMSDAKKFLRTVKCCPPSPGPEKKIKPFVFPKEDAVTKMRWPAHKGTEEQVKLYRKAIKKMRCLPEDHPHSFKSQAKIHCAYCDGSYFDKSGDKIQIHNTWLFFPFHRWYVYFYERILAKLSGDPENFAMPYWNWDDPEGMEFPQIFLPEFINCKTNPLYDIYRDDVRATQGSIVDLTWPNGRKGKDDSDLRTCNLRTVYRDLIRNGCDTTQFFGGKYVVKKDGEDGSVAQAGSVEKGSHTAVHRWVGNSKLANNEDMGKFYSAGYDPLFYVHHANVDRMWKLWKDLGKDPRSPGHVEPIDPDWLNASYVFYDENGDLVRVTNEQSVDLDKLKYNYIENTTNGYKWQDSRPPKREASEQSAQIELPTFQKLLDESPDGVIHLDKIVKFRVERPGLAVRRSIEHKKKENEILKIVGIKFDSNKFVKFDVFVNDKISRGLADVVPTFCDPEYAGGFAQMSHAGDMGDKHTMDDTFGLTQLLEDTNTDDQMFATVALVPLEGCEDLTISNIEISLVPI